MFRGMCWSLWGDLSASTGESEREEEDAFCWCMSQHLPSRLRRLLRLLDAPLETSERKASAPNGEGRAENEETGEKKGDKGDGAAQGRWSWHSFSTIQAVGASEHEQQDVDKPLCPLDERCLLSLRRLRFGAKHRRFLRLIMQSDRFLEGMPRVIAGLIVALYRGFVDPDDVDMFTNDEILSFGPVLPPFLEILSECKYSLWEVRVTSQPGKAKEESASGQQALKDVDGVVDAIRAGDTAGEARYHAFRAELEENLWKRVKQMDHLRPWAYALGQFWNAVRRQRSPSPSLLNAHLSGRLLEEAPELYSKALRALRHVVRSGLWPGSGTRRSRLLIAEDDTGDEPLRPGPSSTFSIGVSPPTQPVPRGNTDFPDLCQAVFELEKDLIEALGLQRKRSAMCAVNRNARFMPHVDAGSGGVGQGRSLIVGLGDYAGGEIVVEGEAHDIRYRPLEFYGWTQRHWTRPFVGERFSLVYFTPRGCEGRTWMAAGDA